MTLLEHKLSKIDFLLNQLLYLISDQKQIDDALYHLVAPQK